MTKKKGVSTVFYCLFCFISGDMYLGLLGESEGKLENRVYYFLV